MTMLPCRRRTQTRNNRALRESLIQGDVADEEQPRRSTRAGRLLLPVRKLTHAFEVSARLHG